jgi:glycosyltransferase involved in cell wall biosynthesis
VKVFFIPSWYPTAQEPTAGIFLRDQALALATQRPGWKIAVSLSPESALWLSQPRSWPNLRKLVDRRPHRNEVASNLVEYRRPSVVWTEILRDGNRRGVIAAHRSNVDAAASDFGKFDLIHAHVSYPAGWVAMHLSEELQIPYAVTEHMSPFPFRHFLDERGALKVLVREPLERAAATTAVSPALAREISSFGLPQPGYVPNLVDETFFVPGAPRSDQTCVFFTLAGMREQKGIDDLLRAVARLRNSRPSAGREWRFRIGGSGERVQEYRELATQLGLDDVVSWLGTLDREAARDEYQRCDCFVLASRHESFGIVYAEANACGKPIIATRSGGPETIVTPENGLLVEVGNTEAIAHALAEMLDRAREYDPVTIRTQFEERFSRPAVVERLESVYSAIERSQVESVSSG